MKHIDGTAARQLDLLDEPTFAKAPVGKPGDSLQRPWTRPTLQVLRKDIYAELARRRRRAQIAARHELDRPE